MKTKPELPTKHFDEYTLTPDEQGMLAGVTQQIALLQSEGQALLNGIIRLRKLQGPWALEGDKLIQKSAG